MEKNKAESKIAEQFWRIIISAVGVALIAIAVIHIMLYCFGETAVAQVSTRRYGGSDDGKPINQRYEWSINYTFMDNKGVLHNGFTNKRGSDMSINIDNVVYYFSFAPFISSLKSEAEPSLGQPLYTAIGIFLIYIMNRKKKSRRQVTANKL